MEQTIVVACIAALVVLGLPAVRTFVKSFESQGSTKAMISAALASARAVAAKEQHYAGIRFQHKYQQDGKGSQYIIFIIHDFDKTELANGFRAVEGIEPIKLPETVGAMEVIDSDSDIDDADEVTDKTTFSIVFSPSGKMVIHEVRTRNRDGERDTSPTVSYDDIFNKRAQVNSGIGMFYQDDYLTEGLDEELSKNSFVIYDRNLFAKVDENRRYSDYLEHLEAEAIYINPYTGTMIEK